MAKRCDTVWVNNTCGRPRIEGHLEISRAQEEIHISGNPAALRSFARLLLWIADVDQESLATQPDGEHFHVHLWAKDVPEFNSLTPFSDNTTIWRLDAKGTGAFPEKYREMGRKSAKNTKTPTAKKTRKKRSKPEPGKRKKKTP